MFPKTVTSFSTAVVNVEAAAGARLESAASVMGPRMSLRERVTRGYSYCQHI